MIKPTFFKGVGEMAEAMRNNPQSRWLQLPQKTKLSRGKKAASSGANMISVVDLTWFPLFPF